MKYIALLRGLNVGGKGLVKMTDLKACFEQAGFKNVSTYIQSGNVIFESNIKSSSTITKKIEQAFTRSFKFTSPVVVVNKKQLEKIVKSVPKGFGLSPQKFRYDVIFLRPNLSSKKLIPIISVNKNVDQVFAGPQVIYFSRLITKITQSRISKIIAQPFYKDITIRNWNTTSKLLSLVD